MSRTVFAGKLFDVVVEEWQGRRREIVEHPGSVAVVALDSEERVVLVRQLREPARKRLLELPAGTLEADEEPLDCARRELREETGLAGGDWTELAAFWTTPGFCREHMTLFLAERVAEGEARPDDDEEVELVRWPVEDVAGHLGEVEDAKTLAGLLLLVRRRSLG